MIAEAAYFRAQAREFRDGDPVQDWLAAESEIDRRLASAGRRTEVAHERLRAEVEKGLSRLRDRVDAEAIQRTVEHAAGRARKAGEYAAESINAAAERLRREIGQATTAMGPRWEAFSDRTADAFAVWRNRGSAFLAGAALAVGEWLDQTGRRLEPAERRAGDSVRSGDYACTQCGEVLSLESSGTLPPCARCGHSTYRRRP